MNGKYGSHTSQKAKTSGSQYHEFMTRVKGFHNTKITPKATNFSTLL